jgi:hypothetical protein
MLNVLKEPYFHEYYSTGFVKTGISLPEDLVDSIRAQYQSKALGYNDFPKFFKNNGHQAYMEGRALGVIMNASPAIAQRLLKRLYDRTYSKAVYGEQACIERVLAYLLKQNYQRFFKNRYMIVSYDMYLCNDHSRPGAGIHTDLPNFHHVYETENDVSIYVPLVDLTEENGGRLNVLPEGKLKVAGNVLLKLLYDHFSNNPAYLDEHGYVDADKIDGDAIKAFAKSEPHRELMGLQKGLIALAKRQYANDFRPTVETKGTVFLFNNKNFHSVERWKVQNVYREIYAIRTHPIYDIKINLRSTLHGAPTNRYLLDLEKGELHHYDRTVDLKTIPIEHKLPI